MNIYTVKVEQIARGSYQIKAETKNEALYLAACLWGKKAYESREWDVAISKITKENNQPSKSDFESIDN